MTVLGLMRPDEGVSSALRVVPMFARLMRFRLLPAIAVLIVAACAPRSVRQTLTALRSTGYVCGEGVRDNVPSGLWQWRCRGPVAGTDAFVNGDGHDAGAAEITLSVDSTGPALIAAEFARLAPRVAPLTTTPGLADALGTPTSQHVFATVGRAAVEHVYDGMQRHLQVVSDGPLVPLTRPWHT